MADNTTNEAVTESAETTQSENSSVTFDNLTEIPIQSDEPEREQVDDKQPSDTPPEEVENIETEGEGEDEVEEEEGADDDSDDETEPDGEEESEDESEEPADGRKKLPLPARKKLRGLEKLERDILIPFRDPTVPIRDAYTALAEYMPTRASELAQAAADAGIQAHPDKWLSHLLGVEGATVESVRSALDGSASTGAAKTAPQPETISEFESFADTPEAQALVEVLTDTYGDDWRDPKNDGDIVDEDLPAVRAFRAQLASDNKRKTDFDAMQGKLKAQAEEIEALKPAVDSIKKTQETDFENQVKGEYQTLATTFQQDVETKAFNSLFKAEGLEISDSDSDTVKGLKQQMQGHFKPYAEGVPSRISDFVSYKFSDRENLFQITQRVDKYLSETAQLEAQAKREKDSQKAAQMKAQAEKIRSHAESEKAVLRVLVKQAGKEFLATEQPLAQKLLEENTHLRKQLKGNVRTELVNQESTGGSDPTKITFDNLTSIPIR